MEDKKWQNAEQIYVQKHCGHDGYEYCVPVTAIMYQRSIFGKYATDLNCQIQMSQQRCFCKFFYWYPNACKQNVMWLKVPKKGI